MENNPTIRNILSNIPMLVGCIAASIQLVRFGPIAIWPIDWNMLFVLAVTWYVFYASCAFGKERVLENFELNWFGWSKRAIKGMAFFMLIGVGVSFYLHHHRSCDEVSDSIYGGCEQYSDEPSNAEKGIPFEPSSASILPILLSVAYYIGNVTARHKYLKVYEKVSDKITLDEYVKMLKNIKNDNTSSKKINGQPNV